MISSSGDISLSISYRICGRPLLFPFPGDVRDSVNCPVVVGSGSRAAGVAVAFLERRISLCRFGIMAPLSELLRSRR